MKKKFIMLLVVGICLLCGCNNKKSITGQIVETFNGTDSNNTQFVIRSEDNEEIGIMMNEQTHVWCFVNDLDVEAFKKGKLSNVMISVEYTEPSASIKTSDNNKIKAYLADDIQISAVLTKDILSLSDGTIIDCWEYSDSMVYQLSDGTVLLRVQTPSGPDNVFVGGIESFNDLSDVAKPNVLAYYANQGLLYDVNSDLERAYADYQQTETKSEFHSYMLSQEISPTASSDKVMYFLTSVSLPIDGENGQEMRLGAAFDRKTGKYINTWELFSCTKEEAITTILDLAQVTDPVLRTDMEKAFTPEYIVLFQDNLEVSFPAGTLPSQENSYMLGLDYNKALCKILNEWAIPDHRE